MYLIHVILRDHWEQVRPEKEIRVGSVRPKRVDLLITLQVVSAL
jgi:hypothetical protein